MKLGISYKTISEVRNFTTQDVKLNPKVYITDVGKEGEFIYDSADTSSSDNLGTILVAGTARYKRVFKKEVNVRWFGAIGDNTVDDTTALSNAVTYCIDNSFVCVFNTGEYKVTGNLYHNLSVNGNKNVYIKFVGDVKITVPSGNAIVDLHMINFSHNNNINAHITGDNCTVELNNKFKGFLRVGNYGFSGATPYVTDGGFCKVDLNNLTILNTYVENVVNTSGDNAASALFINGTFDRIDIKNVYVNSVTRSEGLSGQSWWGDCKGILVNNTRATVIIKDCTVKNILSHVNFDANADGIAVFGLGSPTVNLFRTGKAFIENCNLSECQTRGIKIQTSDATVSNCRFERNTVVSSPNSRDIDFQYGNGKAFNNTIIFKKNGATTPLDQYHASIRWCAILEDEEMYGIAENNTFYTDVVIPYPFFINYRDGLSIAVERSTYDVINNHIINTDDFTTTGCIGKSFVEFDAYYLGLHETQGVINIRDNSYFSSAQPLLGYNSAPVNTNLGDKLVFTLENNRNTNLSLVPLLFSYSSGGVDVIKVNRFKIFNNSGFSDRLSTVWIVDFNNLKIMPHSEFVVDLSTNTVANGRLLNAPAGIPTIDYAYVKVLNEWVGWTHIQIYVHGSSRKYFYEWNGASWKSHSIAVDSNIGQHQLTLTTTGVTDVTLPNTGTLATLANTESLTNKTVNGVTLSTGAGSTNFLNGDGNYVSIAGGGDALVANPLSQFASTTSSQLAGVISDETGSGNLVFSTSPTLVTPILGVASATSINKLSITAPATGSTLTIADGKTLTLSNTLTFTGTDSSSVAFGAGGTVLYSGGALGTPSSITLTNGTGLPISTGVSGLGTGVAAFLATPSSANLITAITDETGTGNLVFSTSPTLVTPALGTPSSGNLANCTFPTLNQSTTGSAATLTTPRTIGGVSFNGSANIVPQTIQSINEAADTTCFPLFISASGSQSLQPLNNTAFTFNASTGALGATTLVTGGSGITIGSSVPFSDSAGTLTLQNVDALDSTTESTIEAAIDTLANLTSIQGQTVTLTGAFIRSGAHSLTLTTSGTTDVTLPTTGTLSTLAGTETLTNKTLTAAKIANAGRIDDPNSNEYLTFVQTGSAVNQLTITNAATAGNPSLSVTGGDTNISLNLVSKGTGVVQANSIPVVTTTGTLTLTNKTLTDAVNTVSTPVVNSVGYLGIPQNSQSTAYTLVMTDAGKHLLHPSADTTARTWTIPANGSVAFPIGTSITFVNQNGAGVITIAITSDTMRLAGAGTTGSRTLAANGVATAIKITSTEWIISGNGLT